MIKVGDLVMHSYPKSSGWMAIAGDCAASVLTVKGIIKGDGSVWPGVLEFDLLEFEEIQTPWVADAFIKVASTLENIIKEAEQIVKPDQAVKTGSADQAKKAEQIKPGDMVTHRDPWTSAIWILAAKSCEVSPTQPFEVMGVVSADGLISLKDVPAYWPVNMFTLADSGKADGIQLEIPKRAKTSPLKADVPDKKDACDHGEHIARATSAFNSITGLDLTHCEVDLLIGIHDFIKRGI